MKTVAAAFLLAIAAQAGVPDLYFAGRADNDLYRVVVASGIEVTRLDSPAEAIAAAKEGAGVLIMADDYPGRATAVDAKLFEAAARKKLRLYVEYPSYLPDVKIERSRTAGWERTVVASDAFGDSLAKMQILMIHDCHFLPMEVNQAHLVLARVAGYDSAVYGLPKVNAWPVLFEHPRGDILVATTKLSQFVTARYAPSEAWPAVWTMVFKWLNPGMTPPKVKATPLVHPTYAKTESLPSRAERIAVKRGVEWFIKGRMLVHESGLPLMADALRRPGVDGTMPGPSAGMPIGDGSLGIIESYSSRIDWQGNQPVRWFVRADCCNESAMAFAFHGKLFKQRESKAVAANLLDFVTAKSPIQQGPRANPESPSYGLLGWDTRPQGATVYYGDDNARALLAMIASASLLQDDKWNDAIVRGILGNFRTTGPLGFRNARIEEPELQRRGWRWYWHKSEGSWSGIKYSPHYQAYLWAVNLWLYDKTKFEPLLVRTENAIRQTMAAFPDQWKYECGRKPAEYARMMLPLAWLVRVKDTPEHRDWLKKVAQKLMDAQDPCGAIGESVTSGERSNEEYGTREASLVFSAEDKCADLLYTVNFAFLALHEAAAATHDPQLIAAADRMAGFLVRIQARSGTLSELDGAWFRGFDFKKWDYWGSNADVGWGVWSTETGWTQGWITSVLAMRQMKTSLWDLTKSSRINRHFDRLRAQMLPDEVLQ